MKKLVLIFCVVMIVFAEEETLNSRDVLDVYAEQKLVSDKSGKYISFGLGVPLMRALNPEKAPSLYTPILFSFKAGSQSFFTKNVGVRGFFAFDGYFDDINYQFQRSMIHSFYGMLSLGLDVVIEWAISHNNRYFLGFFAGAGFGAVIYTDNQNYNSFSKLFMKANIIVEGGVELTLAISHRIGFGVKLTPIQKDSAAPLIEQTDFLPFVFYSYKF